MTTTDRPNRIVFWIMAGLSLFVILLPALLFTHQIDCRDDGECVTAGLLCLPGAAVVLVSWWSVRS